MNATPAPRRASARRRSSVSVLAALAALAILIAPHAIAQPAPGYYETANTSSPATLRASLHAIIDDHTRYPYTSSSTDTWDILEIGDEDQDNAGNVITIYRNASYPKQGGGNTMYNREHSWPKSYGFPNDGSSNYPYTDTHHLFLADSGYNSSRSNKPFDFCPVCDEKPTDVNNGRGGPGDSNWTTGSFTQGSWEVWSERRGDIARALMYMDVRYEGGVHGITGAAEPDLILTDDRGLIAASNTGSNEAVAYMGLLSVLLQWHDQDPVDLIEFQHNEAAASFQGNRNPFVDHPEWVDCVFRGNCTGGGAPDTTPPASPAGLSATGTASSIDLDWLDNAESDLAGYNVYRADVAGGPYQLQNTSLVSTSAWRDSTALATVTYHYVVTAVDNAGNESSFSAEVSVSREQANVAGPAWINEFHYDNDGADTGEFIEVAGPAGLSLSGWQLVLYNGNGGGAYGNVVLSGTLPDQDSGFGTLAFDFAGLQNGSPDGIALVDAAGAVIEFLSYEGTLVAADGPAAGQTSTDIGVAEGASTPIGWSLQRTGTGQSADAFAWVSPQADTYGSVNSDQHFSTPDITAPAAPTGLVAIGGNRRIDLGWNANSEPDLAGYRVHRAFESGGPYAMIASVDAATIDYTDRDTSNNMTYYYVITAIDSAANESPISNEASAAPQKGGRRK